MKEPKALLIDLDDTLICYDGYANEAWTEACGPAADHDIGIKPLVEKILGVSSWFFSDPERHRVGRNDLEETRRHIVRKALKELDAADDTLGTEIGDRYSRIRDRMLYLFPGARETLESLKNRGIPMCLVTNGERHIQRRKIERFLLEPYFKGILVEGELGFGKPDERVFLKALEILNTRAEETWVIGDNYQWEVIAPSRLGFTTVWVDKRGGGLPADVSVKPDAIIDTFSELLDLVAAAGS